MNNTINGKTQEEIKKGLECCPVKVPCSWQCQYYRIEGCGVSLLTDAHAYIQQLEAAAPKWISVKEKHPDAGEWVLTYCGGYANWFDLNKWCGDCWLKTMPITHWMPLPEPPKEEKRCLNEKL